MDTQHTALWQLIDVLDTYASLVPDKIKQVLPTDFSERFRYPNTLFYAGGPFHLTDEISIKAIDLRVRRTDETQRMIVLDIAGVCITLDEVSLYYPYLVITNVPRGRSLDEKTNWSTYRPWGKLSFGFKEHNPECLASVVINRDPLPTPTHQQPPK